MRLITVFELAAKRNSELNVLYRDLFNALARSDSHSAERRNCLASLENVRREISSRAMRP